MVIVPLIFTVLGSVATALACFMLDASWGMIALAYLGGGWAGLLIGLPATLYLSCLARLRAGRYSHKGLKQIPRR